MSKTLVVFGATGNQGSSIVNYVLDDTVLSKVYKIRIITRDPSSEKVKQFKDRVEVIKGDVSDRASLETALTGAHTIFAMTTPHLGPNALEVEYNNAKSIADVAVEKSADYIIFSTLPPASEISGGKYTKATPFDAKAKAEKYIRSLPIKSAFYCPGSFMENYQSALLGPRAAGDGTWIYSLNVSPKAQFPLVAVVADTGKYVGAILAQPEKYEGKTFCAATKLYSLEDIAAIMSKVLGKTVVYKQISTEEFKAKMPPGFADVAADSLSFFNDFGYYGPEEEKLIAWAGENARGKLTTFEEYLEANPPSLT